MRNYNLGRHTIKIEVPKIDIKIINWYREIAIDTGDKMVYVEDIRNEDDTYRITLQGVGENRITLYLLNKRFSELLFNGKPLDRNKYKRGIQSIVI